MDWQQRYTTFDTPWDLRQITPPLAALLRAGTLDGLGVPSGGRVAVPGCGRGHDLRAFARAGYRVTGFDLAPGAVAEARALLALNRVPDVEVYCRDLFGLDAEFERSFDLVFDYTCLCALPPHLRGAYGRAVAALLASGGLWLGLAYPLRSLPGREPADGPPFLLSFESIRDALGASFRLVTDFDAVDSVPLRAGSERWFVFRRLD